MKTSYLGSLFSIRSAAIAGALLLSSQLSFAASTVSSVNSGTKTKTFSDRSSTVFTLTTSTAIGVYTVSSTDYYRQYLVFDLAGSNFSVDSGQTVTLNFTFTLQAGSGNTTSTTLNFWDASSTLADVTGTKNVAGTFADLGTGTSYGSVVFDKNGSGSYTYSVVLNQAAINEIAKSGKLVIGVDANTVTGGVIYGAVTKAELVSSVPLPPAALLFGPAVFAIGAVRRKQLSNKADKV